MVGAAGSSRASVERYLEAAVSRGHRRTGQSSERSSDVRVSEETTTVSSENGKSQLITAPPAAWQSLGRTFRLMAKQSSQLLQPCKSPLTMEELGIVPRFPERPLSPRTFPLRSPSFHPASSTALEAHLHFHRLGGCGDDVHSASG